MNPKYKPGDSVSFEIGGTHIDGTVAIVDPNGFFAMPDPVEPSYDIIGDYNGKETMIKHVRESSLL